MKNKKTVLMLIFTAVIAVSVYSQQYDSERDFMVAREGSGVSIIDYLGTKKEVRIPTRIQNLPVTSIGDYAFNGCTGLTSITIPDSVASIGGAAFSGCTSLTAINVSAGNNAFTSESGILYSKDKFSLRTYPAGKTGNSYTIPNYVTSIGWGAFQGSANLTSVIIPDSVTSIGNNAFSGCEKLTSVTFQGVINKDNFSDTKQEGRTTYFYNPFYGDLRAKFYATDTINGTPGTYIRSSGSNTWTKQ